LLMSMLNSVSSVVIYFSIEAEVKELEQIEQYEGKLSSEFEDDKLMHSVLEGDKEKIDDLLQSEDVEMIHEH